MSWSYNHNSTDDLLVHLRSFVPQQAHCLLCAVNARWIHLQLPWAEQGSRSARLSPQSMIHYARKLFKCSKNSTGFHNIGNDQMTRRPEDKMTRWPDDTMTRWPNDHIDQMTILTRWPDDHMTILTRWPDNQKTRRPDDHMTRWPDDQMTMLTGRPNNQYNDDLWWSDHNDV